MKPLALILLLALFGCASTPDKIVAQPTEARLPIPITDPGIVKALKADAANLDQAVAIGAIPADDPAPGCVHDILRKAGIESTGEPPKAFIPDQAGKLSIAYILVKQARNTPQLQISPACFAIYGELHFNALRDAVRLSPLGRLP